MPTVAAIDAATSSTPTSRRGSATGRRRGAGAEAESVMTSCSPAQRRGSASYPHTRRGARRPPIIGAMTGSDGALGRFLTLADVAEILNVSAGQAYGLVRSGELPAIKV